MEPRPRASVALRSAAMLAVAALAALVLSACGNTGVTGSASSGQKTAVKQNVSFIPQSQRALYQGFSAVSVTKNPLAGYHPPTGALKYCLAESYTKEAFRVGPPLGSIGMFKKLVQQLQAQGKASGPLVMTDSNNNVSVQLSQMNNLVQQGCDVIFTYPGSATGLCSAVKNAYAKGVLVVSYGTEASCPNMISVDVNEYRMAYLAAENLAKRLNGKGNVLLVNAIKGVPAAESERQGALDALAKSPGIKVKGEIYGDWTSSVAKSEMLKYLSTHPDKIDGVWQAGLMSAAVDQGLQQAGRSGVKIEAFSGTCSGLALWHKNGGENFSFLQAGEPFAYMSMQAAQRVLAGAKPVSNVLLFDEPLITQNTLDDWYQPGMTENSNCYPNAPEKYRVDPKQLDPLFTGTPGKLPELTYATGKSF
jgi:ribose transport system substrate-binding protein